MLCTADYSLIYENIIQQKSATKIDCACDHGGVRTPNPQSRNLIFYPVELRGQLISYSTSRNLIFPARTYRSVRAGIQLNYAANI